jgi:hypothetical protein
LPHVSVHKVNREPMEFSIWLYGLDSTLRTS